VLFKIRTFFTFIYTHSYIFISCKNLELYIVLLSIFFFAPFTLLSVQFCFVFLCVVLSESVKYPPPPPPPRSKPLSSIMSSVAGFTVGVRRNPKKMVPGKFSILVMNVRKISLDNKNNESRYSSMYATLKYKAHDTQRTGIVATTRKSDEIHVAIFEKNKDAKPQIVLDIPHVDFNDHCLFDVWETEQKDKQDNEWEDEDVDMRVGRLALPIAWILNAFGTGFILPQGSPTFMTFQLRNNKGGATPYEVDLRLSYKQLEHDALSALRFGAYNFHGSYELDRSRSVSLIPLYEQMQMPVLLRKIEEEEYPERLEIDITKGGNAITFTTKNRFFKQSSGLLNIQNQFQSVKTHMGTIVEKRMYWDTTSTKKLVKQEPYPSPILIAFTRIRTDLPPVSEAWNRKVDEKGEHILTHLVRIGESEQKFQRVYIKQPIERPIIQPALKTHVPPGVLHVGIIRGINLVAPMQEPINALVSALVYQFDNSNREYDAAYARPNDTGELFTRVYQDENPFWNQKFKFKINDGKEEHSALVLTVLNQDEINNTPIGLAVIPVPWLYNGCGAHLGPGSVIQFQGTFKLRKASSYNPNEKAQVGFGQIELRLRYTRA
jgi:C2 domain